MYVHMTPETEETKALKQLVIDHMPTAAYHSGLAPKQDHAEWMAPILAQYPRRPSHVGGGTSRLSAWLTEQGIAHTNRQCKALQDHWILEFFRDSSREKPIDLG